MYCETVNSVVYINVLSNGQPNHCTYAPTTTAKDLNINFKVKWLSTATMESANDVNTQTDVNDLICNIKRSDDSNIPSSCGYTNRGANFKTMWGVATSGGAIYNSISGLGVDPFYPDAYGSEAALVTNPDAAVEKVDPCMAHPSPQGDYHYHIASTCRAKSDYFDVNVGNKVTDIKGTVKSAYAANLAYRSAYGVSKDGRPIYTPLVGNGNEIAACDLDVCNGMELNGNYVYYSTLFHPYFMGCYGKGSKPELYAQCSTNPRLCNTVYKGAIKTALSWGVAGALAVAATL